MDAGEEGDQGTSIFHKTRLVGPIFMGGLASGETPELFGSAKGGQEGVAPWTTDTDAATMRKSNARSFIG